MFFWVYDIPTWLLGALFSALFVGFTWLGTVVTRPWVRRWVIPRPDNWNEVVGNILESYVGIYGILLGLIAVATYQNLSDVDKTVAREASSLGALYRDVSCYPGSLRGELQVLLREYCQHVIKEEWPAQQRGMVLEGEASWITTIQQKLLTFEPVTKAQEILHGQTLHQFNVFVELHHQRLQSATTGLPPALWYVVGIGALLAFFLTWLFIFERLSIHLAVAGTLALLMALGVFVIVAMDYPFRGEVCISAEAFEIVYKSLMAPPP